MAEPNDCDHSSRRDGRCTVCGDCDHDVVLNGACFYCGETDLPARVEAPAADRSIVPLSRLRPGGDETES